jgi:Polyketide cyclase / dehydrase and lipid transport
MKAYYSTVFGQSADEIWRVIRDFNSYPVWVDGAGESHIENGRSGDAVGAVRNVLYDGKRLRQRLVALSDADRTQTYEFCDETSIPVRNYRASLRIIPIVDGNHGFVEWWAHIRL